MVNNSDSQISEVNALNPRLSVCSRQINVRVLILEEFSYVYVKGVSVPGKKTKTDKPFSVKYLSLNRPEVTTLMMVDLSWKTIKFKQQTKFHSFNNMQEFKKVAFFVLTSRQQISRMAKQQILQLESAVMQYRTMMS